MSKYKVGDKVVNVMLEDHTVFQEELNQILDEELRKFVSYCLDNVPKYFYHIPASSSGKYHPIQDLGEGGLVRHTKAVVQVGLDLLRSEVLTEDCNFFKDIIISACLLHDTFKNGVEDSGHTVSNHPILVSDFISKVYEDTNTINVNLSYNMINIIIECILSHMGKWNTDKETGEEILPKPVTDIEKLVHLADYIASRKYIDMSQLEESR